MYALHFELAHAHAHAHAHTHTQMMGRAGRPQYDRHGYAVIMVHEPKKQFYKRFLYEPFPVESSLANQVSLLASFLAASQVEDSELRVTGQAERKQF